MATPPAPPYPLAMVICDAVWRDPATGKYFILGCFSAIGAAAFPTVHPALSVYVAVTEGYGSVSFALRLVDGDNPQEALHESSFDINFSDPRAIAEIAVNFQNLSFTGPGDYRLQLHAGASFLMERRIAVHDLRQRQPGA
jgi:hypothetical protein